MPRQTKELHSSALAEPSLAHESNDVNDNNAYRLIVCCELSEKDRTALSKNFTLVNFSSNLQIQETDAALIDCRGKAVVFSELIENNDLILTFALVDDSSWIDGPTCSISKQGNIQRLEIITTSELNGTILKLRLDAMLANNLRHTQLPFPRDFKPIRNDDKELYENAFEVLQECFKQSTDWMVIKDLDHRFIAVTQPFLDSKNIPSEQILGRNDIDIGTDPELVLGNPAKNWKGFWKLDEEVTQSGTPTFYHHNIIQENSAYQIREHVAKIPLFNKHGNVFALLVCVTQSHIEKSVGVKAESVWLRSLEEAPLLHKISKDQKRAEAANQKTLSAFKRKNNFIATASHDIRQPLHAIGLFIESLDGKIQDLELRSTLSKMKQSSKDLNELINNILNISKLDAGAVTPERTDFKISKILKSIENEFETEAKTKSLTLTVNHCDVVVYTDSLLLMRIIRNLVSNAIKHTRSGSVNVNCFTSNQYLTIEVLDTGPGIPKEQYETIFNEYLQLNDDLEPSNFGMGLGLSIVKGLTDILNLKIDLESKVDQGTRFSLTVPLGKLDSPTTELEKPKRKLVLENYKVMIIEDNPIVLEAMHELLSSINCIAYPAADIGEAMEIINELKELPDLLLVDYQLANGITGDSAIDVICKNVSKSIPAIIITGNTNSALLRKANLSQYPVLTKPVSPNALISNINSAIQEQRKSQGHERSTSSEKNR